VTPLCSHFWQKLGPVEQVRKLAPSDSNMSQCFSFVVATQIGPKTFKN